MKHRTRLLVTSNLCFSAILLLGFVASSAHAFDPNEGAAAPQSTLPSTLALTEPRTRGSSAAFPRISRVATTVAVPPIAFAPLAANKSATEPSAISFPKISAPVVAAAPSPAIVLAAPSIAKPDVISKAPEIVASSKVAASEMPKLPPVDAAVKAKAEQELSKMPVTVSPPMAKSADSFIAPLPLLAPIVSPAPVMPLPIVKTVRSSVPDVTAPVAATTMPMDVMSRDSKTILSRIPSQIDKSKREKTSRIALNRSNPDLQALDIKSGKVDAYEASGIKISVRRPGLDTNYELNRAFTALSGGDTATAIDAYKGVLSTEPLNADALFGLASVYHRQGQLDKARPLYGVLLKNYPNHREGINNFLALVSDESPQEALAELERLGQRNPDFSPIPAQEALVLNKLGYAAEARNKMLRAIELSPDNLAYKYNLAIMLDRDGNYADAADIYRVLIDASSKGAAIPTSADALQKRLNYISTATTVQRFKSN
jgi:Flp pilus assembly protein TadD